MTTRIRFGVLPLSPLQVQTRWRETPGFADQVLSPAAYTHLARVAEDAGIDYLFLPDKNTVNTAPGDDPTIIGNSWPEPITLMTYLAGVTERIGLIATASSVWHEPYVLARTFQTLDHLSGGRAGWNAVSSHVGLEDHNFGHRPELDGDARKRRHAEFVEVVRGLWDSWSDDAVVADAGADPDGGRWAAAGSVRPIDHRGEFFDVAGPLNIARSPQGRPVIVQAGASESFRAEAARTADIVFTMVGTVADGAAFTADLRAKTVDAGRPEGSVLVMPGATVDLDGGAGPMVGHMHFRGSGRDVAEEMAEAVDAGACDGFTVMPVLLPRDLERFAGEVMPELQRIGAVSVEADGDCLRARLGLPR